MTAFMLSCTPQAVDEKMYWLHMVELQLSSLTPAAVIEPSADTEHRCLQCLSCACLLLYSVHSLLLDMWKCTARTIDLPSILVWS